MTLTTISLVVYAAALLKLFGLLARDELWLRLLLLASTVLYQVYYLIVADAPLWDAFVTNAILGAVNLMMILIVISERTTVGMTKDAMQMFRSFDMLTPGQFRRLLKAGSVETAGGSMRLTNEGEALDRLYFVISGPIFIGKGDTAAEIAGKMFIGEIAYLKGTPASATVDLGEGSQFVAWDHERLRKLEARWPALRVAMVAQFNADLMGKVAESMPMNAAKS